MGKWGEKDKRKSREGQKEENMETKNCYIFFLFFCGGEAQSFLFEANGQKWLQLSQHFSKFAFQFLPVLVSVKWEFHTLDEIALYRDYYGKLHFY